MKGIAWAILTGSYFIGASISAAPPKDQAAATGILMGLFFITVMVTIIETKK